MLVGNRERQVKGQISCKLVKPHNLNLNRNPIIWPVINNLGVVIKFIKERTLSLGAPETVALMNKAKFPLTCL